MGAPEDIRRQFEAQAAYQDFEVLPENWETVLLFLRVQTQWRTGMSGVVGLDYAAVERDCSIYNVPLTPELMDNIRVMEMAAMAELNRND